MTEYVDGLLTNLSKYIADLNTELVEIKAKNAELLRELDLTKCMYAKVSDEKCVTDAENAELREQLGHLQPIDCEGNVLDIADKVHMLRSEYDGDHEWDDVVVELALAKWGGDRWIVRGSKGEAWACDCERFGYDEDAYENSDNAELVENPTLIEVENERLRELCSALYEFAYDEYPDSAELNFADRMRELRIEVEHD